MREVVAVKFGIIVYDAFQQFLGGLTANSMDSPTVGMKRDYNPLYVFRFEKYGVVANSHVRAGQHGPPHALPRHGTRGCQRYRCAKRSAVVMARRTPGECNVARLQ